MTLPLPEAINYQWLCALPLHPGMFTGLLVQIFHRQPQLLSAYGCDGPVKPRTHCFASIISKLKHLQSFIPPPHLPWCFLRLRLITSPAKNKSNQKVVGCPHNNHATIIHMAMSFQATHCCGFQGLKLCKTVGDFSSPAAFQYHESKAAEGNLQISLISPSHVIKCMVPSAIRSSCPVLLGYQEQRQ